MTKANKALMAEFLAAEKATEPLPIGTKTQWGKIKAVHSCGGERQYFMIDARGTVALMPAEVVEGAAKGGKQCG